ncbi:MAG: o-succinylbenzoate--CoA ligase, partial [Syntrophales bacterium LBB04]|nr:o-succinylbenzoate--CoA ligase [Syntrophales bacterium LBB04]
MAKATRYTPELIEHYMKSGMWETTTFSDVWDRNAEDYPTKEALVDSRVRLTWSEAKQWIDRVALGLLELGLKKDEMVVSQL